MIENSTPDNSQTDSVIHDAVKSNIVMGGTKSHTKQFLLGGLGVLLVIVVIAGGIVVYQKNKQPPIHIDPKKDVTAQVQALTPKQAQSLANQKVDPKTEPDSAYVKAVAQAETGNAKAAVVTYQAVVAAKPTVKYYVYYDYAIAAAKANNLQLAQEQMQKAIDAINADGSVSANVKQSETDNMEQKLQFFKIEAQ